MERKILTALFFLAVYCGLQLAVLAPQEAVGGPFLLWPATALLIAVLIHAPRAQWPLFLLLAALGSAISVAAFGGGPFLIVAAAIAHTGEGWIAARLLRRRKPPESDLLTEWLSDTAAIAAIAPGAAALVVATLVRPVAGWPWLEVFGDYLFAHALGNLVFFPFFGLILGGGWKDWTRRQTPARKVEMLGFLALVAVTTIAALWQANFLPYLIPVIAGLIAACRFGMTGATLSVAVLAVAAWAVESSGVGPLVVLAGPLGGGDQFLQFYLALAVVCLQPLARHITQNRRLNAALWHREAPAEAMELALQAKDLAISESQSLYKLLAENITDVVLKTDRGGYVLYVSPSFERLGWPEPMELVGRHILDFVHPSYGASFMAAHEEVIATRQDAPWTEYLGSSDEGEEKWFDTRIRCVLDGRGTVTGAIIVMRNIEERKALEQQLFAASLTDPLTNLTNRRAFYSMLQYHLDAPIDGCLAMFDIDDFRSINRKFGHEVGDRALTTVAKLLRTLLRRDDIISRIGGERFAVLLSRATPDQAEMLCQRVVTTLSEGSAGGSGPRITVSAGVARIHGTVDETMNRADSAVVIAKAKGRNRLEMANGDHPEWFRVTLSMREGSEVDG